MELHEPSRPWWDTLLGNFSTFLKLGRWILLSWLIVGLIGFAFGAVFTSEDCSIGTGL